MENENTTIATQETEGQEQVTYTETQVMEMLQKEADRRVSQALAKQQAKFEQKMAEADKLREMDATQRSQYEFEQKMKEFEEQKREFTITQNKLEASKVMAARNLPVSFVDMVVADNAEDMLESINAFEQAWKAAINDEVSKRIASPAPKTGSVGQSGMTKEQFKKLNLAQQADIFRTNPTLYHELTK